MEKIELPQANLVEVFSSIQGEGLQIGQMQSFVRFQGCSLRCRWCDTPENFKLKSHFRFEEKAFSNQWKDFPNPVNLQTLNDLLLLA